MTLESYQLDAATWLSKRRRGLLASPAGSGKTCIAAAALDRVLRQHSIPTIESMMADHKCFACGQSRVKLDSIVVPFECPHCHHQLWRCERLANAVARLREPEHQQAIARSHRLKREAEPDPRQKDEWLAWTRRPGGVSLEGALKLWNIRISRPWPAYGPEPDPNERMVWLGWRMQQGVSSLQADTEHKARLAEWNDTWQKELGGHLE